MGWTHAWFTGLLPQRARCMVEAWVLFGSMGACTADPSPIEKEALLASSVAANLHTPAARTNATARGAPVILWDSHDHYAHASGKVDPPRFDYLKRIGDKPSVALTFDCAYVPVDRGEAVLDALKEKHVHATFFLAGPFVFQTLPATATTKPNPATLNLIRRMLDEGHEVGNHSHTHPHNGDSVDWRAELTTLERGFDQAVHAIYGDNRPSYAHMLPYWRAPYGEYDGRAQQAAANAGFPVHVGWNVDARDALGYPNCVQSPQEARCMSAAKQTSYLNAFALRNSSLPGFAVLAHLGGEYGFGADPRGLRAFIDAMRASGREFAKVSEVRVE